MHGLWKKQRIVLIAFGVFMAFMFACTLISRAVYVSKLPQVSVERPGRMAIGHQVKTEGIVSAGREFAVTTLPGVRVKTVHTYEGERVTPESLLFELDTDDLRDQIQEQELAIQKLKLQLSASEQNRVAAEQEREKEKTRAQEDYARTQSEADAALSRAQQELDDAEEELEDLRGHPPVVTPEEERKAKTEEWNQSEAELSTKLDSEKRAYEKAKEKVQEEEQKEEIDQEELKKALEAEAAAQKSYEEALALYETHQSHNPATVYSAEDAEMSAWQQKKDSLKDKVKSAEQGVEDAAASRADALTDAGRGVEDASAAGSADNSAAVDRLELSALEQERKDYQALLDAGGLIYPQTEGVVTRVQVSPGERTGDGAAVVCADLTSPMQFHVSLTKEEKKYVNQGDTASLKLANSFDGQAAVDYIAESAAGSGVYEATVFLPEGVGTIGQSGTFEVKTQSENYNYCFPIEGLHVDSTNRYFVYVVSKRAGILGEELAAEIVYVDVLDKNDVWVAVEAGIVDEDTEIIVSSTEELSDRAVIRYRE